MTIETPGPIADAIRRGELDSSIKSIRTAIWERMTELRRSRDPMDFEIGTKVSLNENCGVAYLRGELATVVGYTKTKVRVQLSRPIKKYAQVVDGVTVGAYLVVPPSMVDPLNESF